MIALKSCLKSGINWLAVCVAITFAFAWINDGTEHLAKRVGPTCVGMLNAAFGNLPELSFGLIAIGKGLGPLVKAAWTGAIISNLLVISSRDVLLSALATENWEILPQPICRDR